MVKYCFEFLNAFRFSLQYTSMCSIGKRLKINRAIIIFNPIQMMDYPTFRQRIVMCLFPYKDMLQDITISLCSRMIPILYKHVAIFILTLSPLPVMVLLSQLTKWKPVTHVAAITPTIFYRARKTAFSPIPNKLAAIQARMHLFFCPFSFHSFIIPCLSRC